MRPSRLCELERCCDEVDRQFNEIHRNLVVNVRKVENRSRQINQVNLDRGKSYREIVEREAQLNVYASMILDRSKSLRAARERTRKYLQEMRAHLKNETEAKTRQLQELTDRETALKESQRALSEVTEALYQKIVERRKQIDELVDRYEMSVSNIEEMTSVDYERSIAQSEKSIEAMKCEIPEMDEQVAALKDAVCELEAARAKLKISRETVDVDMATAKDTLKSLSVMFKQNINEAKGQIIEQKQKKKMWKMQRQEIEEEAQAVMTQTKGNAAKIECEDKDLAVVEAKLAKEKEKVIQVQESLSILEDEQRQTETKLKEVQEQVQEKEEMASQYTVRIADLAQEREQIQCEQTIAATEKTTIVESASNLEENEKSAEALLEVYQQLDAQTQEEAELAAMLQTLTPTDTIEPDPEVQQLQQATEQQVQACEAEVEQETQELASTQQQIATIESHLNASKSQLSDMQDALTKVSQVSDSLWKGKSQPTLDSVTEFVESSTTRRNKRVQSKQKAVHTLENRVEETHTRIALLRDRLIHQRSMVHSHSAISITNKADLVFQSVLRSITDELSVWKSISADETETALDRWQAQLADLIESFFPQ